LLGKPEYSGAAQTDKNVGVHVLTVRLPSNTATNNYAITYVDGEFEITKKSVSVSVIEGSKIYDGQVGSNFDFEINGLVRGDTKESFGEPIYGGTAIENSNAGEYTLSVKLPGNSNYEITDYEEGVYTILKRKITITPVAATKTYDGSVGGEFDFVVDELVDGETKEMLGEPTYAGTAITAKNAGKYSLTISIGETEMMKNYNISYSNGTFEILKKGLTVTAIARDIIYGDAMNDLFSFKAEGLVEGETVDQLGIPNYGGTAVRAKNAGQYTLTVSFVQNDVNKNYQINVIDDTFEIGKKTLTVTAMGNDRVYGEEIGDSFSITVDGLVNGDTIAQLGTPIYGNDAIQSKEVGTYTLTVSFAENAVNRNYDITYISNVFEITKKDLTIVAIAEDRAYDEAMVGGNFSYSLEGLVDGDEQYLGKPIYGGSAVTAAEVGSYILSVEFTEFVMAHNYNIVYVEDSDFVISASEVEQAPDNE
jgi:hypothetical protein